MKLLLFLSFAILAGCATAPAPRVTRSTPIQRTETVYTEPVEQAINHSPTEYHTTYYDKQGSTHDVITEVDSDGNQTVLQDNILVFGPDAQD